MTTVNNKKTTTTKKTKKNSHTKKPKKNPHLVQKEAILREVFMICTFAFGLLLFVSIYTSKAGLIGKAIANFIIGCFGFSAYILPPAILLHSILVLWKKLNLSWKNWLLIIMFFILSIFVHVIHGPMPIEEKFLLQIKLYYQKGAWNTGGVLGALLGQTLLTIIGTYGTYIFIFTTWIVCILLLTEKSLWTGIVKISKKISIFLSEKLQSLTEIISVRDIEEQKKEKEEEQRIVEWLEQPLQIHDHMQNTSLPIYPEESLEIPIQPNDLEWNPEEIEISLDSAIDSVAVTEIKDSIGSTEVSNNAHERDLSSSRSKMAEEADPISSTLELDTMIPEALAYEFPPMDFLKKAPPIIAGKGASQIRRNAKKLEETLASFGVQAKVNQVNRGPTVTRYEVQPSQGVKVSRIVNLADDIALNLAASGIRIEAPIPGKAAVGIEVPNEEQQSVFLREVLEGDEFQRFPSKLAVGLGKDIGGNTIVADIGKMPHLLIAGATGSGKSVCINTLITSIIYKADPKEVKLLMIDPKVVELSVYNGIPHLLIPVVTDPKKAAGALNWAVQEMITRYQLFAEHNARDIKGYNNIKKEKNEDDLMPQIVIIIDELADLMMAAPKDVEDAICRLAQMARAAGIHLIIATQRPSVDVITGVIKANIPSRLAFAVSSGTDSRTILDMNGAEKLLGKGDMLFYPVGMAKPIRIQGAFISDKEVEKIVDFIKQDPSLESQEEMVEEITGGSSPIDKTEEEVDEYLSEAIALVVGKERASISMLQRTFRIGFNRASRIVEAMEQRGIVGPDEGSKPRKVLVTEEEWESMQEELS
ncbi:MAG: DNA translocase FtsK [Epulopiscium sp.]|nr:DNA translocase FtsK [Candidatus Epulonipiscium sp.]